MVGIASKIHPTQRTTSPKLDFHNVVVMERKSAQSEGRKQIGVDIQHNNYTIYNMVTQYLSNTYDLKLLLDFPDYSDNSTETNVTERNKQTKHNEQ